MAYMHRLRFIFGLLIVELIVVSVLGVLALDNNQCDYGNGWHWTYETTPPANQPTCGMLNVSVATSEGRFDSLIIGLATIPVTAIWGYLTARRYERKDSQKHESQTKSDS